jgi:uncharacterized RDD family membrane protein YckC
MPTRLSRFWSNRSRRYECRSGLDCLDRFFFDGRGGFRAGIEGEEKVISASDQAKGGFLIRVVARIIDAIILAIIGVALSSIDANLAGTLSLPISVIYFVYFWSTTGQTIGHKVMGLRVVRTDGSSLDVVGAIIRYIGAIVSAIPLGLGYLWVIWDPKKQGWHDKIAGTYVIKL